mmetsp:Transcript_1776/g.6853  ORF Transcript_1776/g.6853 Transcript_1776/m.6853 type:complete len:260 (+) Transcript_1776:363-1142(+)
MRQRHRKRRPGHGFVHERTLASVLSLSRSSSTLATVTPGGRGGGALTEVTALTTVRSTPRSAASSASSGFFLAFMMLGSLGYRGVFKRKSAVTRHGRSTLTVSMPASVSRSIVADAPSAATSTLEAKVTCGHWSSSASMGPVVALSPSMACLPRMTRSGASRLATSARSRAVASGWSSWSSRSSVATWTARSAPIASADLSVSTDCFGPTETATTSDATPASFSLIASSHAISQNGFIDILTLERSTPEASGATRTRTA